MYELRLPPSRTAHLPPSGRKGVMRPHGSRSESFHTCSGSQTARGSAMARHSRHSRCCFPSPRGRQHLEITITPLNFRPACAPVNASPTTSRPPAHDSGSVWFGYSFTVGFLPPLPSDGLCRRTEELFLIAFDDKYIISLVF